MRSDELLARNLSILSGYLTNAATLWRDLAKAALDPTFKFDDYFEGARKQFEYGWKAWLDMTAVTGVVPTLFVQAADYTDMSGATGAVYVQQQLTGLVDADFTKTTLERFGPGAGGTAAYSVTVGGNFDRQISITFAGGSSVPAADIYRGMILATVPGGVAPEPIAWVVLIAE